MARCSPGGRGLYVGGSVAGVSKATWKPSCAVTRPLTAAAVGYGGLLVAEAGVGCGMSRSGTTGWAERGRSLSRQTAEREFNRQLELFLPAADELIEEIESSYKKFELEYSDEPSVATTLASERQVLRAIRHAILAEMVGRLMG